MYIDNKKVISVITVCYNSNFEIVKTIDSLKSQTCKDFEYIVIDGNSNDGTLNTIVHSDIVDKYVSENDSGIYDAMNKGFDMSTGDYIVYLNADDIFEDNFIEEIYSLIEAEPDFIYSSVYVQGLKSKKKYIPSLLSDVFDFRSMPFPHPGLVVKRNVFEVVGKFNLKYRYAADLDWIFRLIKMGGFNGLRNINSSVVYTAGGGGNSMTSLLETVEIISFYNSSMLLKLKLYLIGCLKLLYVKYIL